MKKACSFTSKQKWPLSDQGTFYLDLEIHWFPKVSKILSPNMRLQFGQIIENPSSSMIYFSASFSIRKKGFISSCREDIPVHSKYRTASEW